jgi:hypothetical protein
MEITIGRIVLYTLTGQDAEQINRRRVSGASISLRLHENPSRWPEGAQAHIGNHVIADEVYPLIATCICKDEFGPGKPGINGQVLLDGNDTLWVTSVGEGPLPGQWRWPARA